MHPWKKIIWGNTKELKTKACFICLERIQIIDDGNELKLHMVRVHSVKAHLRELVEMCTEAEEREEREGWSLDDILDEERSRKEFEARKKTPECCCNNGNAEAETTEVDCFLCQEKLKSCAYSKHLEKQHGVIFGVNAIKKASESNNEPCHRNAVAKLERDRTDADIVKELVEMRDLSENREIRTSTRRTSY